MFPLIRAFLEEHTQLYDFLLAHEEISLASGINHHFRKIFLLYCASYYELQITNIIKCFVEANSSDDRVLAFVTSKAIERQYHTYFCWDSNNINSFLGLFGSVFRDTISSEIKKSDILPLQAKAFLTIGFERNKMVHENFIEYSLEKTFDELVALDEKASAFIEFLKSKFSIA